MRAPVFLAFLTLSCSPAIGSDVGKSTFRTYADDRVEISGSLFRPAGHGPYPAIVALHGCGGLFGGDGQLTSRHADWGERFRNAGYVVLFPDSFGSRGHKSLCKVKNRPVKHSDRAGDLRAAADWLASQSFVDPKRIVLLGWSNGGSTVLRAVVQDAAPNSTDFLAAIAFYPSCRWALKEPDWNPRLKPVIHIGAADDWTPPGPCKELAAKWSLTLHLYDGAYHGFDAPNSTVRVLKGRAYSANGDGNVHVGTHPKARAAAIASVMKQLKETFSGAR